MPASSIRGGRPSARYALGCLALAIMVGAWAATAWRTAAQLIPYAAVAPRQAPAVALGPAGPFDDSPAIRAMGFPVFHAGFHPADSLGRLDVTAHNVPVECGGVLVCPGDLVLADHDGVVVVPHAAAEETLRLAEEKVSGENLVRKALAGGMSTTEAFKTYGIL